MSGAGHAVILGKLSSKEVREIRDIKPNYPREFWTAFVDGVSAVDRQCLSSALKRLDNNFGVTAS